MSLQLSQRPRGSQARGPCSWGCTLCNVYSLTALSASDTTQASRHPTPERRAGVLASPAGDAPSVVHAPVLVIRAFASAVARPPQHCTVRGLRAS